MKIGVVNKHHKKGGAAIAADRLVRALLSNGNHVTKYVDSSHQHEKYLTTKIRHRRVAELNSFVRNAIGTSVARLAMKNANVTMSPAILNSTWPNYLNASDVDVINLHWINGEMMSIRDVSLIQKPMVWTLHDMWPILGAKHYDDIDSLVASDAHQRSFYFDKWVFNRKIKYWKKPIQIITPSHWLASCVKTSKIMSDWPVNVIANPIDTEFWKPLSKVHTREHLGIPIHANVLMFGAIGGGKDPRKGFDLLVKAIEHLTHHYSCDDLVVLVVGQSQPSGDLPWKIPTIFTGHLSNEEAIRDIYNAADLLVIPSKQDNLPNTGLEAMSCGVPVVAFNVGGLADIVEHKITGYLANAFDCVGLAEGINWILTQKNKMALEIDELSISAKARRSAEQKFAYAVIAEKYMDTYRKLV